MSIVDQVRAAATQISESEAELTRLLIEARTSTPPVPLALLAEATGMTVQGVSIRVRRATTHRD